MIRRAALLIFLAGCDPGDSLRKDWRGVPDTAPQTTWTADDLRTPWSQGLRPSEADAEGQRFAWSAGSETRVELDVLDARATALHLTGFPYRGPGQDPPRVEVLLNDVRLGILQWEGPATRTLAIPAGLLVRGRNRLRLRYDTPRRPAEVEPGNPDRRLLAMAWRQLDLATDSGRVRLRADWLPFVDGARLRMRGVARDGVATVRLLRDPGSGIWSEFAAWEVEAGRPWEQEAIVGHVDDAVGRLGILVEGEMEWERLESRIPRPAGSRRPDILLVTLDTTRRDALAPYNQAPDSSPHLGAWAQRGVVFEDAWNPTPATAPTHASMWSSRPPHAHGLVVNGMPLPRLAGDLLPRRLEAWGYETAGFVSLGVLAADTGFDAGFARFDDRFDEGWWRFAEDMVPWVAEWLEEHPHDPGRPRFLWVHFSDPHKPYGVRGDEGLGVDLTWKGGASGGSWPTHGRRHGATFRLGPGTHTLELSTAVAPDAAGHRVIAHHLSARGATVRWGTGWRTVAGYRRMEERATILVDAGDGGEVELSMTLMEVPTLPLAAERYRQEVVAMDRAFGELMARLEADGWTREGLVTVIADHGEDLGEEGHFGHVHHLQPRLTRVPWFLVDPTVPAGRVTTPVGGIDLAPTLFARLGLPGSRSWWGVDALEAVPPRGLHLETFPPEARAHWRAVVDGGWRLEGRPEDPASLSWGGDPPPEEVAARMRAAWEAWSDRPASDSAVDPAMEERLRALGYIQ